MRQRISALIVLAFLMAHCVPPLHASAQAAEVTTFRGNAAFTGEMPGPGPSESAAELWSVSVGYSVSGLVFSDDIVYVAEIDGAIFALSASTGAEIWSVSVDEQIGGNQIEFAPAIHNGIVYVLSSGGHLFAFDARNGEIIWSYLAVGEEFVFASPTAVDDLVFFVGYSGRVYAIDTDTGAEVWVTATADWLTGITAVSENIVYVAGGDAGWVHALDESTGEALWSVSIGGEQSFTWLMVSNDILYASSSKGTYALNADSGQELWAQIDLLALIVADGVIYATQLANDGSEEELFVALDAFSGDQIWSSGPLLFESPPVLADETIYIGGDERDEDDSLQNVLISIDAASGQRLWDFQSDSGALERFAGRLTSQAPPVIPSLSRNLLPQQSTAQ